MWAHETGKLEYLRKALTVYDLRPSAPAERIPGDFRCAGIRSLGAGHRACTKPISGCHGSRPARCGAGFEKKRFESREGKIRATYGHSFPVELSSEAVEP